ncbi:unnamed protein product [Moneuplotes crassus]|uniref:Uncharacterized protein n=1 Tax=Euplotes crassus TaxID=5936 RepID=A0AAD1XYW0_EUPCR|nr:unnamed protein product [Moneuplotes crassus]
MEKLKHLYVRIVKQKCIDKVTSCFWSILGKKKIQYKLVSKNDIDFENADDIECHKMDDEADYQGYTKSFPLASPKNASPENQSNNSIARKKVEDSEKKITTFFTMSEEHRENQERDRSPSHQEEGPSKKNKSNRIDKGENKQHEVLEEDGSNGWGDDDFDKELDINL